MRLRQPVLVPAQMLAPLGGHAIGDLAYVDPVLVDAYISAGYIEPLHRRRRRQSRHPRQDFLRSPVKTTSINQLPMYEDADALQYGTQMAAVMNALDPRVIAGFSSLSAANSAYGAFTAAGGVLRDGMMRAVAGDPQIYRNGKWRGIAPTSASQTTFFATTISDGSEVGVATLAVPDPGWPYILDVSAVVMVAAQAATQVNVQCRLDTISGTIISQDSPRSGQLPAGEVIPIPLGTFPTATLTGAHTVIVSCRRTIGGGNWAVPSGGSIVNCLVRPSYA